MEIKYDTAKQQIGQWKKEKKIRKYLKTNANKNTTFQNLWDTAEANLKGKFIAK